eukprot:429716-Rhodomonas_salina.1
MRYCLSLVLLQYQWDAISVLLCSKWYRGCTPQSKEFDRVRSTVCARKAAIWLSSRAAAATHPTLHPHGPWQHCARYGTTKTGAW